MIKLKEYACFDAISQKQVSKSSPIRQLADEYAKKQQKRGKPVFVDTVSR